MFEPKGYITIPMNGHDPDELFELAVEAGAEDVMFGEDTIEVYADIDDFQGVQEALSEAQIEMDMAEMSMIPQSKVSLELAQGLKLMGLVDALEELDDVEQVYTNLNITDEMFEQYAEVG
jgi:transcriptional/translational regulatory protein YebC/TACO1